MSETFPRVGRVQARSDDVKIDVEVDDNHWAVIEIEDGEVETKGPIKQSDVDALLVEAREMVASLEVGA